MNAVKSDIEALVKKELEAANKKFPLFNSAHEGYAVLLEEVEELDGDCASIKYDMQCLWGAVKGNNTQASEATVQHIFERAVNAAIEAIQVAAMCEKYEMSIISKDEKAKADNLPQNADKVYCKDCKYYNNADELKPTCCNVLYEYCYQGKKRGDKNA